MPKRHTAAFIAHAIANGIDTHWPIMSSKKRQLAIMITLFEELSNDLGADAEMAEDKDRVAQASFLREIHLELAKLEQPALFDKFTLPVSMRRDLAKYNRRHHGKTS